MKYDKRNWTSRVGERGQITVPKDLRLRYGVRPGEEVEFEARKDGVLIRRVVQDDPLRRLLGRVKGHIDVDEYIERTRGPAWTRELDEK